MSLTDIKSYDFAKQLEEAMESFYCGSSIYSLKMSDPKFLKSLHDHMDDILEANTMAVRYLARMGWFFPIKILVRELVVIRSLPGRSRKVVDKTMCKIYKDSRPYIQEELCDRFPKRCNLINESFLAHDHGWYSLSVLGFLSLADGIFIELSGIKSVYGKKDKHPLSKKFVDQVNPKKYISTYLELFRIVTALNEDKHRREPTILNRHAVMHGTSTDYGTEINSLKSLSFLYSVWTITEEAQNQNLNNVDKG